MKLVDWLDDLCVRFIINLPPEELESVERICFQVEEAQWFYEDFIRPLDPNLPTLTLRAFSLRIFQHCPLFSQWSGQDYESAFAEFLAYKQRVPVRGAIMLNEDMDQVVLVKGWKKNANWGFPRGKINKDEDDLDCAIREVYEETGFDIKEAGLVKDAKDMKYIEVIMRESHMRLYIFRGVPLDAYFEPQTRKEISKIEWYKLTDLPTLKKHKQQDSNGEHQTVNANKFYMVAPFLPQLKRWIAQQRKNENRQHLPYLNPPKFAEQAPGYDSDTHHHNLEQVISHGPSDLPEVTGTRQSVLDPTSDLKRLFNINLSSLQEKPDSPSTTIPRSDAAKSSALLALLRSGSTAEMRDVPNSPREQISFSTGGPRSPHRQNPHPLPFSSMPAPPPFQVSPEGPAFTARRPAITPSPVEQTQNIMTYPPGQNLPPLLSTRPGMHQQLPRQEDSLIAPQQQLVAPYQRTGDPEFSHQAWGPTQSSAIPPASALPKLTGHTRALLDVFKMGPLQPKQGSRTEESPSSRTSAVPVPVPANLNQQPLQAILSPGTGAVGNVLPLQTPAPVNEPREAISQGMTVHRPNPGHQASLLDLFRQPSSSSLPSIQPHHPATIDCQPAELAADVVSSKKATKVPSNNELLVNLFKKESAPTKTSLKKHETPAGPRGGETSATVSGPLNQPQFDGIVKPARKATNGYGQGRGVVAPNKTLYDPKQPTPIKILARPEDPHRSPARSPRLPKVKNTTTVSPKRVSTPQEGKEAPKPFQPQILRRPKTAEKQNILSSASTGGLWKQSPEGATMLTPEEISQSAQERVTPTAIQKRPSQVDSHRQALLSLFNEPLKTAQTSPIAQDPMILTSPVPVSQPISPLTETQPQGLEPISTRSRMGSLAPIGRVVRPSAEKRQTAAGDKAFLLGYLGRIASQEG